MGKHCVAFGCADNYFGVTIANPEDMEWGLIVELHGRGASQIQSVPTNSTEKNCGVTDAMRTSFPDRQKKTEFTRLGFNATSGANAAGFLNQHLDFQFDVIKLTFY